jgi:hypothetical protein
MLNETYYLKKKTNTKENKNWRVDLSFRFGFFLCKHYHVASVSTNFEYNVHIMEQRIQLLQGATLGFNDGET